MGEICELLVSENACLGHKYESAGPEILLSITLVFALVGQD